MAKNDQILDFQVSMELSHGDASVRGVAGRVGGRGSKTKKLLNHKN